MAPQQTDGRFIQFSDVLWGIRAMARILRNYQRKHGLKTVREMIDRWAPPVENDTGSYARAVASGMGLRGPDEPVDLMQVETLADMIQAMVKHENGLPNADSLRELYGGRPPSDLVPGRWYRRADIRAGIGLE
ncbi:hypothetical protein ACFOGJ_08765 [Marinibaculum pumilum]|uniref:Structural protein P5 n=1 Tax=Marinibaculum pumilum TaxID=1766165 RepID=A0ABV7KY25_9PROT